MDEEERRRVRQKAGFPRDGIELFDFNYKMQPVKIEPKTKVALLESHESGALRPQPFRAAADELRRKGENLEASALEIEWRRRSALANRPEVPNSCPARYMPWHKTPVYWLKRGQSAFLRWTVGYGFRPWRVLYWAAGVIAAMSIFLALMPRSAFVHGLKPSSEVAVLCAAQTFLPLIRLGPLAELSPTADSGAGIVVGYVQAGVSIVGWILAAALGAGIVGFIRKTN